MNNEIIRKAIEELELLVAVEEKKLTEQNGEMDFRGELKSINLRIPAKLYHRLMNCLEFVDEQVLLFCCYAISGAIKDIEQKNNHVFGSTHSKPRRAGITSSSRRKFGDLSYLKKGLGLLKGKYKSATEKDVSHG